MSILIALHNAIAGCVSVSDLGGGAYEVLMADDSRRPVTAQEISDATAAAARADIAPVESHRLKLALDQMGLLDSIEAWVLLQSKATQIAWREAPQFERESPMLNAAAAAYGLTDDQVDAVFALASSLVV